MQELVSSDLACIYGRDPQNASVLVADGYGIHIRVERGHLDIHDGQGARRRHRRLARSQRTVRRLILLGHTGAVTLEAIRWCADTGIAIIHIDTDGRILATLAPAQHNDPRLVRAQALAPATGHALALAIELIDAKLAGQATNADRLDAPGTSQALAEARQRLAACTSADEVLRVEAAAARDYFVPWRSLTLRFARADATKMPDMWRTFDQRTSVLTAGHSPRSATRPINALLNYCYRLAEAEARLACRAVGLDPTLGVLHADRKDGRDSLALDLLEPVRPIVDAFVLNIVRDHIFVRRELIETRDGVCRLLPPLTHDLVSAAPAWAQAVGPWAERVAGTLGSAAAGKVRSRRPLTGRGTMPQVAPKPAIIGVNCPDCGRPLADRRRLRCPDCHQAERVRLAHERAEASALRLAALWAQVPAPSAAVMRSATASAQRAANAAWEADHPGWQPDPERFRNDILPGLQPIPIATIANALNVGHDAAWRIREGTLTPHGRHWTVLGQLGPTLGVDLANAGQQTPPPRQL